FTLFIFLYLVILPATLTFILWKGLFNSQREWAGSLVLTALYIVWVFFSGHWDSLSYYIRYIWVIIFLFAAYQSIKKMKPLPFRKPPSVKGKWTTGFLSIIVIIFLIRNIAIIGSFSTHGDQINLSFPLKEGTFYVGHGGSNTEMNYHHAYEPQQYALDISQLNKLGMRAKGIYPKEIEKYVIYGAELYSPCEGSVLETENKLPDLTPPNSDPDNPTGNYVALQCDGHDATIYMAHMQKGSVEVTAGDNVKNGELLGLVGKSGNTSEPHLHIHEEKDGVGIKMILDDKYPVRNSLIKN